MMSVVFYMHVSVCICMYTHKCLNFDYVWEGVLACTNKRMYHVLQSLTVSPEKEQSANVLSDVYSML